MRMSMDNMVIQLADRKMLTIRDTRDIRIECNEGMVWLTVEGQAGDLLLGKGEHLMIKSNGPVFIQGMPYGLVKLASAASTGRQTIPFAKPVDLHAVHTVA
jgi:hypothetical protein